MEWIQVLTIIASIVGGAYYFSKITKEEIKEIKDQTARMDANHREDMRNLDAKFERMDAKFERMQAKTDATFQKFYDLWSELTKQIHKGK